MGYLRKLADLPRNPPVTTIAVIVCIALFVLVNREGAGDSQAALESAGWRDAHAIWDGQWWPLITTAFLHYEIWHLAFNIYWLWVLGGRLELVIGSKKFLAFVLGAAFFSSAMQLAFFEQHRHRLLRRRLRDFRVDVVIASKASGVFSRTVARNLPALHPLDVRLHVHDMGR